jgi:hypothetical protein
VTPPIAKLWDHGTATEPPVLPIDDQVPGSYRLALAVGHKPVPTIVFDFTSLGSHRTFSPVGMPLEARCHGF